MDLERQAKIYQLRLDLIHTKMEKKSTSLKESKRGGKIGAENCSYLENVKM